MSVALYAQPLAAHNVGVFEMRPGVIRTDMIVAVGHERIAGGLLPQRINVDGGFHLRSI